MLQAQFAGDVSQACSTPSLANLCHLGVLAEMVAGKGSQTLPCSFVWFPRFFQEYRRTVSHFVHPQLEMLMPRCVLKLPLNVARDVDKLPASHLSMCPARPGLAGVPGSASGLRREWHLPVPCLGLKGSPETNCKEGTFVRKMERHSSCRRLLFSEL